MHDRCLSRRRVLALSAVATLLPRSSSGQTGKVARIGLVQSTTGRSAALYNTD